ncbi:mitochondrial phosphate carrier protein [Astrocystis sublimbata]|nr:mitochondrial phosphate carrier protein [Astrocystis sublimbata]
MFVTRAISVTNFLVATSALSFQVCVLYPWHKQLDEDFEELKKEHLRVLGAIKGTAESAIKGTAEHLAHEHRPGVREMLGGLSPWSNAGHSTAPPMSSTSLVPAAELPRLDPVPSVAQAVTKPSEVGLYSRYAAAGAVCCSFTHAILTPVDIVKTRIQIEPQVYNRGLSGGLRQVVAGEGAGALATGLGPTVAGYFLQGAFKFGGYELLKTRAIDALGYETACNNRYAIYLGASAIAEMAGDIVLCPFEAVRIRLVSQPGFGRGLWDGLAKIIRQEGIQGLYSGLGPIMFKQVPYTMATFVVYENALEQIYKRVDKTTVSSAGVTGINLGSGLIAGIAATLVSQPADTMLSKINKGKAEAGEGIMKRLWRIAKETGVRGSYAGVRARLVMVGGMTALQLAVYGDIKKALGATGGIEIK